MSQRLLAIRDPLAWLVLGGVAASSLLVLILLVIQTLDRGIASAAGSYSSSLMSPFSALVVVLAVLACVVVSPRSPQAGTISLFGLIVVVAGGALAIVLGLVGLAGAESGGLSTAVGFLRMLASYTVVVASVVVLLRLWQETTDNASEPTTSMLVPGSQLGGPHAGTPASAGSGTWQPQPHAGAVWGSARDAATGSQVTGWGGAPGAQPGWTPASLPPQAPHRRPDTPGSRVDPPAGGDEYTRIASGYGQGAGSPQPPTPAPPQGTLPGQHPGPQSGPQTGPGYGPPSGR